jgi:hypothetical protein
VSSETVVAVPAVLAPASPQAVTAAHITVTIPIDKILLMSLFFMPNLLVYSSMFETCRI